MTSASRCGALNAARVASQVPVTASSSRGKAHHSTLPGPPEMVAMSTAYPACMMWCIGSRVSTGWLPVEKKVPLRMSM